MKISFLDSDQISFYLSEAYLLLEESGIQVGSEKIRDHLLKTGFKVLGEQVFFPSSKVKEAISAPPDTIELWDRNGKVEIWGKGQAKTLAGIGVTNLKYQEPETDEIVPYNLENFRKCILLGNSLEQYEIISTPGILQEESEVPNDMLQFAEMLAYTKKPLMLLVSDEKFTSKILDIYSAISQEVQIQSVCLYVNPISPMKIPKETVIRIEAALENDIPLVYSAYSMMGATSPIRPEAAFVMHLAELLAGLTIIQTLKPGHPVALGMLPARFDMQAMVGFYDYTSFQINLGCLEVMEHLGIPHAGTSGSGNGWGVDINAVSELWINHFPYGLTGKGMMPFIGGLFDSLVFSPELVVYSNEILVQIRKFQSSAYNWQNTDMVQITKGKNYLIADETIAEYAKFQPSFLSPNMSYECWSENKEDYKSFLKERTIDILNDLEAPPDSSDIRHICNNHIKKGFL